MRAVRTRWPYLAAGIGTVAAFAVGFLCWPDDDPTSDLQRRLRCGSVTVSDIRFRLEAQYTEPRGETCSLLADCRAASGGRFRMDLLEEQARPFAQLWPGPETSIIINGDQVALRNGQTGEVELLPTDVGPGEWRHDNSAPNLPSHQPRIAANLRALTACLPASAYRLVDEADTGAQGEVELALREPAAVLVGTPMDRIKVWFDGERDVPATRQVFHDGAVVAETEYLDYAQLDDGRWVYTRAHTTLARSELPVVANRRGEEVRASAEVGGLEINTIYEWFGDPGVLLPAEREVRDAGDGIVAVITMSEYEINTDMPDFWFYIPTQEEAVTQ